MRRVWGGWAREAGGGSGLEEVVGGWGGRMGRLGGLGKGSLGRVGAWAGVLGEVGGVGGMGMLEEVWDWVRRVWGV